VLAPDGGVEMAVEVVAGGVCENPTDGLRPIVAATAATEITPRNLELLKPTVLPPP